MSHNDISKAESNEFLRCMHAILELHVNEAYTEKVVISKLRKM